MRRHESLTEPDPDQRDRKREFLEIIRTLVAAGAEADGSLADGPSALDLAGGAVVLSALASNANSSEAGFQGRGGPRPSGNDSRM